MKRGSTDAVAVAVRKWRFKEIRQRMRRWARVWSLLRWNGADDQSAMTMRELALQNAIRDRNFSQHFVPPTRAEKAEVAA